MCSDPTNQVSSSNDTEHFWQDALCVLNGFDWPFQVQVYSEIPPPLGGKLPARTIRLSPEGLKLLGEKYKVNGCGITNTLLVPELCIIPSVSALASPQGFIDEKVFFGETYRAIQLASVHATDVILWAPPAPVTSSHYNLELIPCKIHFVGNAKKDSSSPYAFISTKTSLYLHSFRDKYPSRKNPGGENMYRAPLNQIFTCENINQVCRHVSQHLSKAHLEYRELNVKYAKHYDFFYKIPESLEFIPNENSTADIELEKELDKLASWLETPAKPLSTTGYLKEGEPLTKEKITEEREDAKDPHDDNHQKAEGGKDSCGRSTSVVNKTDSSHDVWLASLFKDDTKENQNWLNGSKMDQPLPFENNEPHKIVLFGNCFIFGNQYTNVQVDGIQEGDTVIASLYDRDDILGKVLLVSDMPSIKPKQVFVGVEFEDAINTKPFEVRHVLGRDQSNCIRNCNGNLKVFIEVEMFVNPDNFTRNILRSFKDTSKDRRKPLCTSDIQIDFSFEANCRDFVATPIDFVNPEKLSHIGIEGNANSCYIDAVLFALYAFTANFDQGLFRTMRDDAQLYPDDLPMKIKAARNVLKYDIVTPLRCSVKVNWAHVYKLRLALSEILGDKSYLGNFMDSEAFISSLFSRVLQVPEFFTFGEDTKDYILQLFPPMMDEQGKGGESKINRSCVQHLLQEYCGWTGVKLQQVPDSGFLIKLPVSHGVPAYQYVYPNLKLHLGKKLLQKKDKSVKSVDMGLRSVICLKNSHFTCFVRTKAEGGGIPTWYFHDSMATGNASAILTECSNLEIALNMVACQFDIVGADHADESEIPAEAISWLDILLTTAYICVYEPLYEQTCI